MRRFLVLFAVLGLGVVSARADLITLDNAAQTGTPGDTLVFTGILSNTGSSTVFLNSADLNLAGNSFTPDFIDPFNNNVPFWLDPGQSTSSIELFDVLVNIPFTDPPGLYAGTYTLLGGIDSSAQDVLGSADFTVTESNGTTSVPEPSSLTLLAAGLLGILTMHSRARSGPLPQPRPH